MQCRSSQDALARISDEEEDDVPEDLNLTFVPAAKRSALAASRAVGHRGHCATPLKLTSSAESGSTASEPKPRTETVYEQERNAKVRQLLAEQQSASKGVVYSLDAFEAPLPNPCAMVGFPDITGPSYASASAAYERDGQRRGPSQYRGRSDPEGRGQSGAGERGGPRRYRMPNPNMSEEEQARYIRHRRNMAVIRNALREVDPDTLEYMQVTQAPDQLPLSRDRDSFSKPYFSTNRGRGGLGAGGGASMPSHRGRGGMRGRGGGGFSPYSADRGAGGPRGGGRGNGGNGGSAPFSFS
ncbi:hypothetical protein LSCM4_05364 [Leishmania orientalis]|uniref:Uncharacterized protein n=1 Tax=Leishmania orientalis TaxID=2249476 RepID=A0A836GS55_9TRYP|nr:hypothetical protein LSCM4_05364 [Leishmania orientalis]